MAGQKFQYDESGSTFFYFLVSFLALVLLPSTYYFWSAKEEKDGDSEKKKECHCDNCMKKQAHLKKKEPWKKFKHRAIQVLLLLGWAVVAILVYRIAQFDYEMANFDPYEILQIPLGASNSEIKKAYKKMSLIYHPDKSTGDEKTFLKLTKAYQALTDAIAKRNWELYGNPDGPGAMNFGIALPSWIVEKENSIWVLGIYTLVFMIGLPTVVGIWWYQSIKYSGDQVLMDTTQLYYYFFHKTPHMILKRVVMVLGASLEFEKSHNSKVKERPSDNYEVPLLIKVLPNLGEKNRERPLCFGYSIKARALIHAHLSRLPLPPATLDKDRMFILKMCPSLVSEMVSCVSQLILLANAGRISRMPSLTTIENCMKLSPMLVQALWDNKSLFLQLPHVTDDMLRQFIGKKRTVRTIQHFVGLKHEERRSILRNLTNAQFEDVMNVCEQLPDVEFTVRSEVLDDENSGVFTAEAIVTVTVTLTRRSMKDAFGEGDVGDSVEAPSAAAVEDGKEEEKEDAQLQHKKHVWQKQPKKNKKAVKKPTAKKATTKLKPQSTPKSSNVSEEGKNKEKVQELKDADDSADSADEYDASGDESENEDSVQSSKKDDDDAEWEKFQNKLNKREKVLEGKSRISHSVHCPFFPDDKQEYWWVYVCDKKNQILITSPYQVTNLVEEEEVQLKFRAPHKPGIYTYTVTLRSDSYIGFDQFRDIKLNVQEAWEAPTDHPHWHIDDDEEEGKDDDGTDISEEYASDDDDDISEYSD